MGENVVDEQAVLDAYMDAPVCQTIFFSFRLAGTECCHTSGLLVQVASLALMEFAGRYLSTQTDCPSPEHRSG
jgi:hypothetical protein